MLSAIVSVVVFVLLVAAVVAYIIYGNPYDKDG